MKKTTKTLAVLGLATLILVPSVSATTSLKPLDVYQNVKSYTNDVEKESDRIFLAKNKEIKDSIMQLESNINKVKTDLKKQTISITQKCQTTKDSLKKDISKEKNKERKQMLEAKLGEFNANCKYDLLNISSKSEMKTEKWEWEIKNNQEKLETLRKNEKEKGKLITIIMDKLSSLKDM
ncbi:hypothetical protein MXL46_13735 [Heyndrickxia sporothermodurans]|uniref:hypothetical protein n=1 Tax=Heyndrickxia sporothermodurans TaxID=46224 RepID=UPI002DB60298|nr:hypothetical protein [Heyndrickxia sporothermodurans]MEB6550151.1 hypothetical protein [Heyndrickxia sporothermodurans]